MESHQLPGEGQITIGYLPPSAFGQDKINSEDFACASHEILLTKSVQILKTTYLPEEIVKKLDDGSSSHPKVRNLSSCSLSFSHSNVHFRRNKNKRGNPQ